MNNFVQRDALIVWDKLSVNRRRTHLTKLMHTAEQVTLRASQNFQKTTQFDTNSSDIGKKQRAKQFEFSNQAIPKPYVNIID